MLRWYKKRIGVFSKCSPCCPPTNIEAMGATGQSLHRTIPRSTEVRLKRVLFDSRSRALW